MTTVDETTAPVATDGSTVVNLLESAYRAIRRSCPELPDVVMITGSGAEAFSLKWGHFGRDRWAEAQREGRVAEMFIGGECLAMGAEHTLCTLLHESAHALACVREIEDTSRQHRYHNGRFRKLAEELGLVWSGTEPDGSHGYSAMTLADDASERHKLALIDLTEACRFYLDSPLLALLRPPDGTGADGDGDDPPTGPTGGDGTTTGRKPRGTGGGRRERCHCQCEPPRTIYVASSVLDAAPITCGACDEPFNEAPA